MADERDTLLALTADIVAAHVSNNSITVSDLPAVISRVHATLAALGQTTPAPIELTPAVSIRSSVKPDYVTCLEDGRRLKMLKRHLLADHGITPAEYRAKWNLAADYPMVAPNYAAQRRDLAKKIGLGKMPRTPTPKKGGARSKRAAR